MSTVPDPRTWENDDQLSWQDAADELFTPLQVLLSPNMAHVLQTSAQSFPNDGTWTAVSWNSADVNDEGMWVSTTPTRVYARRAGWHRVWVGMSFSETNTAADATGIRGIMLYKNGSAALGARRDTPPGHASGDSKMLKGYLWAVELNVNDYVELRAMQWNSGTSLISDVDSVVHSPEMFVQWWGRAT